MELNHSDAVMARNRSLALHKDLILFRTAARNSDLRMGQKQGAQFTFKIVCYKVDIAVRALQAKLFIIITY